MDDTKNYYNGIAKGYKNLYHEEQILKIEKIETFLPKKGTLLDLGSGDGVLNQFISKDTNLISFDLSIELLKLNPNKKKINGSALNLPFKNNTIDNISSFTVFQDLPDVMLAIAEAKRVLKKDGTFILSFLKISSKADTLIKLINENFFIEQKIEEIKDYIFVLRKK